MRAHGSIEVRDLGYVLQRPLLEDVSLTFRPGELTALSGPSGSGKTTLLSIVGGLVEATTGEVTYADRPTWLGTGDPSPEFAFVLQVYGLVPILSALENVSVALRARGVRPDEADERAAEALARFHIADLGERQVEELSGGQMQRVACARGFVVRPEILLADEPTSELDEGNRSMVLAELRAEAREGAIVVVATHDPAVVAACDRHYALDEGRLVVAEEQHPEPTPPVAPTGHHRRDRTTDEASEEADSTPAPPPRHARSVLPEPAEPHGLTPTADEPDPGQDSPFARPPRES